MTKVLIVSKVPMSIMSKLSIMVNKTVSTVLKMSPMPTVSKASIMSKAPMSKMVNNANNVKIAKGLAHH